MASKNLDVGIKYTGDAKDFKQASAEARREAQRLRKEAVQNSQEMERKFKGVAMSVAKVGAAFAIAQQGFKLYEAAMNSTEGSADKLEEQMGYLHGAVQGAMFSLFGANNWAGLITNIKNTAEATRDLVKAEDELTHAKARNLLTKGDLEIKLQAAKLMAASETDPTSKKGYLQEAVGYQQQITAVTVSEIQQRITAEEEYYKTVFGQSEAYWDFVKNNIVTIAKNYDAFYSQREANEKRLTDLNYQASLGQLTGPQQREREGLMMLLSLMRDYKTLQDDLSKKGQFEAYLGFLGEIRQAAALGDAEILRMTKQIATLDKTIIKAGGKEAAARHGTENIIPGTMTPAILPSLSQIQQSNQLMTQSTAILKDYSDVAMGIAATFENLFSAGLQGWDAFGKAALQAIEQIIVKLAAMGALYLALSFIPGFAGFMEFIGKVSGFMNGNFIQGKLATSGAGGGGGGKVAIYGRDMAWANYRSAGSLGRVT
jgi:hypothetical protein